MKLRSSRLAALVAGSACVLCAGAGIAQGDVEQRASELKIYALGEISVSRYEVVGRPWVDSWRSAFWVPTFPEPGTGHRGLADGSGEPRRRRAAQRQLPRSGSLELVLENGACVPVLRDRDPRAAEPGIAGPSA